LNKFFDAAKKINCISCGKIIAEGYIKEGVIRIKCRHCGVFNNFSSENEKIENKCGTYEQSGKNSTNRKS
jgi:phage FluMu protein Com